VRSLDVRARWALTCAALVVVSGAAVLVVTLVLIDHLLHDRAPEAIRSLDPPAAFGPGGPPPAASPEARLAAGHDVTTGVIADARRAGIVIMGVLVVVAIGVGWWVAGRLLRPVHRITDAARSVSGARLGERIALGGPDDELRRLADTFDAMLDRLDVAFASQRTFVADASHELRTPLSVMRAEIEVALDDPDADVDELRASLTTVLGTVEGTTALVERLLHLSRADTLAVVERHDLATSARSAIAQAMTTSPATAPIQSLAEAPVRGDPVLLDRLAGNLVENAVRHNMAGGRVWVSTYVDGDSSVLVVENDGPVVAADEVAGLFARFRRRDDAHARTPDGAGLGLAIVAAVARTHGGTVAAQPRAEGGLRVEVRLPRAG
jgi:signal transduction histidine kinase